MRGRGSESRRTLAFLIAAFALIMLAALLRVADIRGPAELTASVPAARCDITFKGRNSGSRSIAFHHSMSRVRIKNGWWKKLGSWSGEARAGGSLNSMARVSMGCNLQRRYRLYFTKSKWSDVVCYYPSSKTYTKRLVINLGDINRYFDPNRSTSSC